jgi:hypothetical protein
MKPTKVLEVNARRWSLMDTQDLCFAQNKAKKAKNPPFRAGFYTF